MKKISFSVLLCLLVTAAFGQWVWDIDFEDTTTLNRVIIDTVSNPNNIWQIGHPDKTVFVSSNSDPNSIVTDTTNTYPTNNTSSFMIVHIASLGWMFTYPKVDIGGYYFVNSDSLTDYGLIEFSADMGNTWFRADSSEGYCTWGAVEELPVFTGNSNGWKHFYYCLQVPFSVNWGDTILYRFTFISDSIQTNKDGLMFDDLHFEDWAEGIPEFQNNDLISVFPNPASNELRIHINDVTGKMKIQVFNYMGIILYENANYNGQALDTYYFINGVYLLKFSDENSCAVKTFIVQH